MLQLVADGLMLGATVSLGAIGLTLTYSILRFANFTHGEFITIGAYAALAALAGFAGLVADGLVADAGTFGELSFGWPLVAALLLAVLVTGGVAVLLDWLLFRRLRRHGSAIVMVIASFGASLALRNLIAFGFGPQPDYFTRALQMSIELQSDGKPISRMPLAEAPVIPFGDTMVSHYVIVNSIPLPKLSKPLAPGNYTLKMKIVDTVSKQSYTVQENFKVTG